MIRISLHRVLAVVGTLLLFAWTAWGWWFLITSGPLKYVPGWTAANMMCSTILGTCAVVAILMSFAVWYEVFERLMEFNPVFTFRWKSRGHRAKVIK